MVNSASVLLCTSSTSTPGASSVSVSFPVARSTWKTHYTFVSFVGKSTRLFVTYQVGDDSANNVGTRQWQTALLYNLG